MVDPGVSPVGVSGVSSGGVGHPGGPFRHRAGTSVLVIRPDRTDLVTRDNAGVLTARTINTTVGVVPAVVTASLTRVVPDRKLHRGDLLKFVVFGTVARVTRRTGTTVGLTYNGGITLRKDGTPVATKVYAPVLLESRWTGWSRLILVARFLL